MTDQVINLTLRYRDGGSANAKRALETVERALAGTSREGKGAAQQAARVVEQFRNLGNLRPNDRVPRWFRAIGTEAAAAAGRIEQLTRGIGRAVTAWGQGAAGLAAGRAVLADPVRQGMDYDRQLRNVANTAYAGQSIDARRAGMAQVNTGVMAAIRAGGGTREGTLGTLDRLVASGQYNAAAAIAELPTLNRFSTASAADAGALADIAIRARQNFRMGNTSDTLDMAMRAGQLGGFELRDMARWLPQQMAAASTLGMGGAGDFAALLAANQAAVTTAGSRDEAGNNLVNLLAKINSQDTSNDAKKLGIDLSGSLAAARAKGTNALDAFVNLTDQVAGRDKRYIAARDRARNAKGDDQRAAMESMADLLQGSAIGKVVQDRQALMALVGILGNRDSMQGIRGELGNARGTGADAFALMAESPSYKAELLAAEKANAMQTALDRINPSLGALAERTAALIQEFPNLSAAVIATTTALTALAAAAGVAAGVGVLTRGGGAAAAAGAGAAAAATAGRLRTAAVLAGGMPLSAWGASAGTAAAAGGGVLAAGAAGYGVGTLINDNLVTGTAVGDAIGEGIARLMAFFGSDEARRAVDVNVRVENGNLVAEVNDTNARQARRQ
ncbi:hypothetical protein METUNv1_01747 [Methyloversatilis universalis FAM5]|uniref:Phage tail tape measure protein domain-containing protein n=1 Tax=Methyloversatilis universalis (strain ATCC BAA-1314 / DSM 25237 / JCM 13912 / CCUG 52030 / FAM5) TaxID=1000565 RepID=F5RBV2_METUF|nr:phage tail tape measure protein [Methyloversatilis universalis]EGK71969.1 hypothetical protein METUNv1_01747 [Methyloversatilis universalis FAM5]